MKEKIMKLLLLLLGFGTTACNEAENPVEYGCPMTKFSIKARVTDTSDRPIEGIKVEAVRYSSSSFFLGKEMAYTRVICGRFSSPRQ